MSHNLEFYIDGAWRPAASGARLDVIDPATEIILEPGSGQSFEPFTGQEHRLDRYYPRLVTLLDYVPEARLAVEVEVSRAHSQWQQASELAEASARVVGQATEAVRLANARYNAGTGTQLDVLSAQVDLTTARTNQIQAYYGYNVAVAALRKAMGQADEFTAN